MSEPTIDIQCARTHNLQDVSVRIPRNALSVITGVSGSGKTSLAFHTLFASGQRNFLKTLLGRSQNWLEQLPRPNVQVISGLPPVIAVRQERIIPNARSTVANVTEMLDYLRVLYARLGQVHCPDCQVPIHAAPAEQIVDQLVKQPERTKLMLLAPMVRQQVGDQRELLERIAREGFVRARIDGELVELTEMFELDPQTPHTIEIVVDRLIIKPEIRSRLADSIEQTLRLGSGACVAAVWDDQAWVDTHFQQHLDCPRCSRKFPPLDPTTFSWATARGACPVCAGTGKYDPLEEPAQPELAKKLTIAENICPACQGQRFNRFAAAVQVAQTTLPELLNLTVPQMATWLSELPESTRSADERILVQKLTDPLRFRLEFLSAVGVDYLALDRRTETLSAGELQRVRLARCLGTQLQGSCYILDEPTTGLHADDTAQLIRILQTMVRAGNTVICVEHSLQLIEQADHVVELGPGGGNSGGNLIFSGSVFELQNRAKTDTTPTAEAFVLSNEIASQTLTTSSDQEPAKDAQNRIQIVANDQPHIQLRRARLHNVSGVDIDIPLHKLVCVTGVSGSGKSTLILDVLAGLVKQTITEQRLEWNGLPVGDLKLSEPISELDVVDQSPPGRNARSCPATYSSMWDDVRKILAKTRTARVRGFTAQQFSINAPKGTCPECQGRGEMTLKVPLLAENRVICPICRGHRFNPATLAVKYQDKTIWQLLSMTIDESLEFWSQVEPIQQKLRPFAEIGLGYLTLGQSASSLSGGESQRMKLARELVTPRKNSLLILDEPTSGLHWLDVSRLIDVFRKIVDSGVSLIVIEHHPLMRSAADWHIQMGPGSGPDGGRVIENRGQTGNGHKR